MTVKWTRAESTCLQGPCIQRGATQRRPRDVCTASQQLHRLVRMDATRIHGAQGHGHWQAQQLAPLCWRWASAGCEAEEAWQPLHALPLRPWHQQRRWQVQQPPMSHMLVFLCLFLTR